MDPITIVKFPFSSRQWPTPPACVSSLFSPGFFFFPPKPRRYPPSVYVSLSLLLSPSRWNNNGAPWIVRGPVCRHTQAARTLPGEVFRASIMAPTHLRSISAYGVRRKNDRCLLQRAATWPAILLARDNTPFIFDLAEEGKSGPARTSRAAMGADKLLLGNLVNRQRVYPAFQIAITRVMPLCLAR